MKVEIYTLDGCTYCDQLKELMDRANVSYTSYTVNRDITFPEFFDKFPTVSGYPQVVIDDQHVGGLVETAKIFIEKGLVSSKKNGQKKTE